MQVKAKFKKDDTTITGIWVNHFDEWAVITEDGAIISYDDLKDFSSYPWLPFDHFCQPYNLEKRGND